MLAMRRFWKSLIVNFSELLEAIETDSDDYEKYRDEAIRIGENLLLLYETGDGAPIQLDKRGLRSMSKL